MSYLIGVTPVSPQIDVVGLLGIAVLLTVLLAIAVALHVMTAPRSDHDAVEGPSGKRLGPVV